MRSSEAQFIESTLNWSIIFWLLSGVQVFETSPVATVKYYLITTQIYVCLLDGAALQFV